MLITVLTYETYAQELQLKNSKLATVLKKTQKELEAAVAAHQDEQQTFAGNRTVMIGNTYFA